MANTYSPIKKKKKTNRQTGAFKAKSLDKTAYNIIQIHVYIVYTSKNDVEANETLLRFCRNWHLGIRGITDFNFTTSLGASWE